MASPRKRVDIQHLLSLGDDLLGVLKNPKDGEGMMKSLEGAKLLSSLCQVDANETEKSLEDYQKKIQSCKEKIDKTKDGTNADVEVEHLQHQFNEKLHEEQLLQQELRAIRDELIGLEHQRLSIEERRDMIKKREKDLARAQNLLSMCASVTNIIPDFEDPSKISGNRNKKSVEKFEFESTESPLDVCNKLWKMA
ncbi:kinetochore protein SPC24 homolog isoform X2 [Curcuma longa]|uniref:kinetochore protein SPC24 homolog isoform X2 n=1 Tax=Curcuma longa TaxID=136217 RepID=UPI003D9F7DC4